MYMYKSIFTYDTFMYIFLYLLIIYSLLLLLLLFSFLGSGFGVADG